MEDALKELWGNNVRTAREGLGLSQQDLAEAIGVDQSTVSRYERAAMAPSVEMQLRLCEALQGAARRRLDDLERLESAWPTEDDGLTPEQRLAAIEDSRADLQRHLLAAEHFTMFPVRRVAMAS